MEQPPWTLLGGVELEHLLPILSCYHTYSAAFAYLQKATIFPTIGSEYPEELFYSSLILPASGEDKVILPSPCLQTSPIESYVRKKKKTHSFRPYGMNVTFVSGDLISTPALFPPTPHPSPSRRPKEEGQSNTCTPPFPLLLTRRRTYICRKYTTKPIQ